MKLLQITAIAVGFFFLEGCISAVHVKGTYANVYAGIAGEKLDFSQQPGKFEYVYRTEGGIRNYSFGTWRQQER